MRQTFEADIGAAARRHIPQITGQAPTGIERHAKRCHGQAAQQGLKAEKRCHGPDLVDLFQQADGIAAGQDAVRQHRGIDMAVAQARLDIRVRLVEDHRIGVGLADGLKKRLIGPHGVGPRED